jgi:hypothetical protein
MAGATSSTLGTYELGSQVYDLAYDPSTDQLWMAIMRPGGTDELVAFDALAHQVALRIALPDTDYNGFLSQIEVGPDGAVWVTEPYALVRYAPGAGITSLEFDVYAPDADGSADDPGDPLFGTWISGLGVDGTTAIIGRVHVPYLSVVDAEMNIVERIDLPAAADGTTDIARLDESLFVAIGLRSQATIWSIERGGAASTGLSGARFARHDEAGVLAYGGPGPAAWLGSGDSVEPTVPSTVLTRAAIAPDGSIVVFDP